MKKKILIGYIVDGYAGGVDKYILNLISKVNKDKYKIDLLTNRIDVKLQNQLNEQGIKLIEVPTLKHPIKQYKKLKSVIKKENYDVAYFNISTAVHCIGILAAKNCYVKNIVVHSHSAGVDIDNKYKRWCMQLLHTMCKVFVAKATTFIACSEKAGEWLFTKKIMCSEKYYLVHNSADLKKFAFDSNVRERMRQQYGWSDKKVIIHVANFTYQKNNEFMIEVFKAAKEKQKNLILVLIGKGDKEQKIREYVLLHNLEKDVVFLKNITNVNEYLQAADLFVLPSYFEGYPISALEAQICGLPCLLSDRITSESKISENCEFLPLKKEIWVNRITNVWRNVENITLDEKEYDNENLCKKIEEIWEL